MPKKNRPLRVALVGAGGIARDCHLPHWRELAEEGRVELVGICDINLERAETEAAKSVNARPFTDYHQLLAEEQCDIVDICTQNRLHAPVTIAALEAGAHVLVEKPMAMNARECKAMIAAAKKKRRKLMVAQHMRFEAAHEKLHEVATSGELGEIYTAQATWLRRRGIPGWGLFHIEKESLGGPLIDVGVHMLDLCLWLMGSPKPVAVSGQVYRMFGDRPDLVNGEWGMRHDPKTFDVEDYATALVRFEGGATLNLLVSWAANIPEEIIGVSVLGDKAGLGTTPPGVYSADNTALTTRTFDWLPEQDGRREEIRHFTECVETGNPVRVLPEESLQVQQIIDAIYLSSKRGKEVAIR